MKLRNLLLTVLSGLALHALAQQPDIRFGPGGVTMLNVEPGTQVAWMSLTRTRSENHSVVRIDRGIQVATSARKADVARPGADQSRSLWVMAAIDRDDLAGSAISPKYSISPDPVPIAAATGSATLVVASPEIELMYVRPRRGAWFISATDGARGDVDRTPDAAITIALESFEKVQGNPHPPETIAAGDLILVIDPRSNRTAIIRVAQ